jgi:hypothetical protein
VEFVTWQSCKSVVPSLVTSLVPPAGWRAALWEDRVGSSRLNQRCVEDRVGLVSVVWRTEWCPVSLISVFVSVTFCSQTSSEHAAVALRLK